MHIFRGIHHKALASRTALTIGNFDGVHRGHLAMLHELVHTAHARGLVPTVLTFEPHPRDFFATLHGQPDSAPSRISTLRDKLCALREAGAEQVIVLRFDASIAALSPEAFVRQIVLQGLKAQFVLVGDDFRFGARRAGDFAQLDRLMRSAGGEARQMPVVLTQTRMKLPPDSLRSHSTSRLASHSDSHGMDQSAGTDPCPAHPPEGVSVPSERPCGTDLRISSSAVRQALQAGDMETVQLLLGRPYAISGHVLHGAKLGRKLGFPTLNLRFDRARPALGGVFVAQVHGLETAALPAVASLGTRPAVETNGRVLLETHVFDWRAQAYGKLIRVELLHKLRNEAHYSDLAQLTAAIQRDSDQARAWFAQLARQTTRDRI
ncbi:MAG: bifunctional riboflavin kinase/FMN adenylyltransferase [Thiomonas sp.]|uniref:bifunctional riboflavin kinase/FMN adenylyltransferase n=1 Tax=Thiomonas sp. TaxID=2047785 RepID=UPI002A364C70|nr:bifunctional riboflavin kinase/FMN adenylyltransferase [Thiomonas sp.]MDY0330986.1 bifunctional riboflavin kinase/FMN adenylyltransferase [Thiomonas sp.]